MSKGERIRALRRAKGISQLDMARLLNTTKQTISKYENGVVSNIPSDRIEALAMILGSTPEYILGWDEEETNQPATADDELTDSQRRLIEFARTVPEDKAAMVLRVLKSIVEADE